MIKIDKNYINGHQTIYQPSQEGTLDEKSVIWMNQQRLDQNYDGLQMDNLRLTFA